MKTLIGFLLLLTIAIFVANYLQPGFLYDILNNPQVKILLHQTPCDTPIHYKIGSVDQRFDLTEGTFQSDIDSAVTIWAAADNGKPMFQYDPEAKLTISMIYDQRQALDSQISNLENNLGTNQTSLNQQIDQYNTLVSDFKSKAAAFNNEVRYWNARGLAPPDVYNRLQQEQRSLQEEANNLNNMARQLNLSTESYNSQVNSLNQSINQFNTAIAEKPEEGLYSPSTDSISIYFASNHDELVHTLAHELGHAMGLDHNPDQQSIMYPYSTKTMTATPDDITEVKNICGIQ